MKQMQDAGIQEQDLDVLWERLSMRDSASMARPAIDAR